GYLLSDLRLLVSCVLRANRSTICLKGVIMEQRLNYMEVDPKLMRAMFGLGAPVAQSGLETSLIDLINFRVSQINGCAYCLDMHSKDLRAAGETEQRLFVLE